VIELNEFGDQMQLSLISSNSTSNKDDPANPSRGVLGSAVVFGVE